jgi:hypothetical protein
VGPIGTEDQMAVADKRVGEDRSAVSGKPERDLADQWRIGLPQIGLSSHQRVRGRVIHTLIGAFCGGSHLWLAVHRHASLRMRSPRPARSVARHGVNPLAWGGPDSGSVDKYIWPGDGDGDGDEGSKGPTSRTPTFRAMVGKAGRGVRTRWW